MTWFDLECRDVDVDVGVVVFVGVDDEIDAIVTKGVVVPPKTTTKMLLLMKMKMMMATQNPQKTTVMMTARTTKTTRTLSRMSTLLASYQKDKPCCIQSAQ